MMSKSAMLPGTGRGGYATEGGRLWRSIYSRFGPIPFVIILDRLGATAPGGSEGLSGTAFRPSF
jgi:hypothetical protein